MEVKLTPVLSRGEKSLVVFSMFSSFSFKVKRIFFARDVTDVSQDKDTFSTHQTHSILNFDELLLFARNLLES